MRAYVNSNRGDRARLTLLPFLIVAICKAVPEFPMINAHYDDEAGAVTRLGTIHMGVATETDAGLMVTVIRAAPDLNIWSKEARRVGNESISQCESWVSTNHYNKKKT